MFGRSNLGRFRLNNPVRVDQPMILISQIQRSGGTLLSRLFDSHPAIHAHPYELSWGRPEKWHWPATNGARESSLNFAQLDQRWVKRLSKKAFYKKGSKEQFGTYPFIFNYPMQKELFGRLERVRAEGTTRQALNDYLTSFFNSWLDYQNLYKADEKLFVTSFIPRVLMFSESLDGFIRDYPDGYVVSSVRHPAGWYASAIKHKYVGSLEEVLDFWMRSARAIVAAKPRLGNRMILTRFEDLVADPEAFMRRVCARTGLPWHETLAMPTFNDMPIKSNSHYKVVTHVDDEAGDRFRSVLPAQDIEEIERLAGDLYRQALEVIEADRESAAPLKQASG